MKKFSDSHIQSGKYYSLQHRKALKQMIGLIVLVKALLNFANNSRFIFLLTHKKMRYKLNSVAGIFINETSNEFCLEVICILTSSEKKYR